MEMLNRAIENARDYEEFRRKLVEPRPGTIQLGTAMGSPPKRPGENREQYRKRIREEARK